jgi:circadian clock protein KaiC
MSERGQGARIASGIPGFDEVVGGGLLQSRVYVLNGAPGAGKTVLASQLCFHVASQKKNAVYVTLLSELHTHLVGNLHSFSFFDPAVIGQNLKLLSVSRACTDAGLPLILDDLRASLRELQPAVVVLDGFRPLQRLGWRGLRLSLFVQDLQALLSLTNTTALLVTNNPARTPSPEQPLVDGIIDLEEEGLGMSTVRSLGVRKFRGSSHLGGRHPFRIDEHGMRVFPRIESRRTPSVHGRPVATEGRRLLGVPGLDALLGGGVESGSTTLVLGTAGSGKTTLGLHFLSQAARNNERWLHFGFFEDPESLLRRAHQLDLPLGNNGSEQTGRIVWQPPAEQSLDELGSFLLETVSREGTERLLIDGLVGFQESTVHHDRMARFFSALSRELRARGVTTMITEETHQLMAWDAQIPVSGVSAIWENIVFLRKVEREAALTRALVVLKARDAAHDLQFHEFSITDSGLVLGRDFPSMEATPPWLSSPEPG